MRHAGIFLLVFASPSAVLFAAEPDPVQRAVAYLSREVPHWNREHRCFSCHNNGDATRALLVAQAEGHKLPPAVLADTLDWLAHPKRWNNNGGDGEFNDRKLARIQFTATLALALQTGAVKDKQPLQLAAADLVADQKDDGHWHVEDEQTVGSPATYGNVLATSQSLAVLKDADAAKHRLAIQKAERWIRKCKIRTTPAAAAVVMALATADDPPGKTQLRVAVDFLNQGQAQDGGWGPYRSSPTEAFDTALAVVALDRLPASKQRTSQIRRGRDYLIAQQDDQGAWTETTRPSGSQSYAQHMSTTGWATLALFATQK